MYIKKGIVQIFERKYLPVLQLKTASRKSVTIRLGSSVVGCAHF